MTTTYKRTDDTSLLKLIRRTRKPKRNLTDEFKERVKSSRITNRRSIFYLY